MGLSLRVPGRAGWFANIQGNSDIIPPDIRVCLNISPPPHPFPNPLMKSVTPLHTMAMKNTKHLRYM